MKLVRDKVPERIRAAGEPVPAHRWAHDKEEHESYLREKVWEEATELHAVNPRFDGREREIEEMADVIQALSDLMWLRGISIEEVHAAAARKLETHGSFRDGVVMETHDESLG